MSLIDIDGVQQVDSIHSSYNEAEVELGSQFVQDLLRKGCGKHQIAILSGYKAQRNLMLAKAREEGWDSIAKPGQYISGRVMS